ncbi:MAG: ribonuclease HII [archaeon]
MTLILGIDDAGRGPLIGPMILAGVLIKKENESFLQKRGVNDSKKLTDNKRFELKDVIEGIVEGFKVVKTEAEDIDKSINSGVNLNTLEAIKCAEIINSLNNGNEKIKVIVDCPSVNTVAWRKTLIGYVKNNENLDISCEHKADANHISVSAASILAKCAREESVAELKKEFSEYGDIGSGYPSDPYTKEFLKKHGEQLKDSGLFRKTWATWKTLFPGDNDQKTLF